MIATAQYQYTYHTPSKGVSREALFIESNRKKTQDNFSRSSVTIKEVIVRSNKSYFEQLKINWLNETMLSSNPNEICQNSNYQKIIALGKEPIPLILEDWKTTNNHWFHALYAIIGENPIKSEHRGRIKLMKKDWIDFIEMAKEKKIWDINEYEEL